MESPGEIENELKSICPVLAGIPKTNVFSVPGNYFNSLEDSILEKINLGNILSSHQKQTGFITPEGYFDTLADNIMLAIRSRQLSSSDEIKSISPVLHSVQNEQVFIAPAGYFEELPDEVVNKVRPIDQVVFRMKRRSSIWQYARAAVMTGIIAISAIIVYHSETPYLNGYSDSPGSQFKSEQQINEGISKLSDEEIIKYLETSGNQNDNESLNNNLDEKQLPDQQDIINEKNTQTEGPNGISPN